MCDLLSIFFFQKRQIFFLFFAKYFLNLSFITYASISYFFTTKQQQIKLENEQFK